jgi:acyl-CoA-binding protein
MDLTSNINTSNNLTIVPDTTNIIEADINTSNNLTIVPDTTNIIEADINTSNNLIIVSDNTIDIIEPDINTLTRFNYITNNINAIKNNTDYDYLLNSKLNINLSLYKYYKQATIGDCNIPEPSKENINEYAKWNAWKEVQGVEKRFAMGSYISIYEHYLGTINEVRINNLEKQLNLLLQLNANSSNTIIN